MTTTVETRPVVKTITDHIKSTDKLRGERHAILWRRWSDKVPTTALRALALAHNL